MSTAETLTVPVEVRAVDEPQRTATMVVCKYGETSRLTPVPERFMTGAFTRTVADRRDRIPFTDAHTDGTGNLRGLIRARAKSWDTTSPAELRAVIKFFDTPEAWELFCRARDGEIDAGSVGFMPVSERTVDGVREITEAVLHHVALLSRAEATPAYDAPRLLEVRQSDAARFAKARELLAVTWDPAIAARSHLPELGMLDGPPGGCAR